MKYTKKQYAAALVESLREAKGPKEFSSRVRGFLNLIRRQRAQKLLPGILRAVERSGEGRVVSVTSGKKWTKRP
jgi:hypothetical protein